MIGTLQLILSDLCDDPAEEREFVEQAHVAALKLVKLIDEIIFVAKTEHGTDRMDIEPIQLAKVFDEVDDLTYLQAANRGIRLEILPPDPGIYVLADLPRFRASFSPFGRYCCCSDGGGEYFCFCPCFAGIWMRSHLGGRSAFSQCLERVLGFAEARFGV